MKPDVPLAPLERCFAGHAHIERVPLVGETWSDHPAGRWTYVLAMHASQSRETLDFEIPLRELGAASPEGVTFAYDWASGRGERISPAGALAFSLAPHAFSLRVLCPLVDGIVLLGDPTKYACAGDRRIRRIRAAEGGVAFDVLGAPGEQVRVRGFAERPPRSASARTVEGGPATALALEPRPDGGFDMIVPVGMRGATAVHVARS